VEGPERSRLCFLERRKRETELLRARAQERLATAEERLTGLRWRGRGERGRVLRSEIALQRTAVRLADEKLAALARERQETLARLPHTQERARSRELKRELRPGHGRQLTLDLGL
jgi:hypothetical protein